MTDCDGIRFYWPEALEPSRYETYRVSLKESDRRNAEDLPPEETVNAVNEVLFNHSSLQVEELVKETVRQLGYSRTGSALDKAVKNGLQEAVRRGTARMEGDRVHYCS
ncbi:hypothetical protein D3C73_1343750 [compost metagenome]